MIPFEIGLYSLGAIVILVYLGFWVPFALMLSSYVGVWLIKSHIVFSDVAFPTPDLSRPDKKCPTPPPKAALPLLVPANIEGSI